MIGIVVSFIIGLICGLIVKGICAVAGRADKSEKRENEFNIKIFPCEEDAWIAYLSGYDIYGDGKTPQEAANDLIAVWSDIMEIVGEAEKLDEDDTKIEKSGAVMVQRGTYYFGHNCSNQDGTATESKPPEWKPDPNGNSVIVTLFDPGKNEQIGKAELYSWWDSCGIEQCTREMLGLTRRNFPSPEELYNWIEKSQYEITLCEICEGICAGYDCQVCPIENLK